MRPRHLPVRLADPVGVGLIVLMSLSRAMGKRPTIVTT